MNGHGRSCARAPPAASNNSAPGQQPRGRQWPRCSACGVSYPIGMKIFSPVRPSEDASVLRSMKSLADERPSPEVIAVWP